MTLLLILGTVAFIVMVIYVREETRLTKQWVMSELWHAHVAHMKECHAEEWEAKHKK